MSEQFGAINESVWGRFRSKFVWVEIHGGEALFAEGDPSDQYYLVVSGRLQATKVMPDGSIKTLGEIGRGESIGEMAILTGEPRSATIIALRDSVLAQVHKPVFEELLAVSENLVRHLFSNLITAPSTGQHKGTTATSHADFGRCRHFPRGRSGWFLRPTPWRDRAKMQSNAF